MTTRELLIQEIKHVPEDLLPVLLHYLRTEQKRRQSIQNDKHSQVLGPYADYWNQFVGTISEEPWERPPQGTLEQREQ